MNYTLHQLRVFIKVASNKSVSKAAEELNLSQPGVSIQLKNFQDQFPMPLTEIIGRKLYLTEFGNEILIVAHEILNKVDQIMLKTNSFRGLLCGKLKIAVVSTGKYVMPYFLSDFLAEHPGIDLAMDVTNRAKVIESLENNEVEFGLFSILPDKLRLKEKILLDNSLYLIGNKKHDEIYNKSPESFLSKTPLIYRELGSATRSLMETFTFQLALNGQKKIELTSNEAVKQAVLAGIGCSVMPLIGIHQELVSGELKIIPNASFPISSSWRLTWLKDKILSPVAFAYLQYLEIEQHQIKNRWFNWLEPFNQV